MAARSELSHRLLELKTAAMGRLAPKVLSRKTSGLDGLAKKLVAKAAPSGPGGGEADPDLSHPADIPEIVTSIGSAAETRAVLHRYEHELYGARDLDLVEELLSDPMYRHDAGGEVTEMSHADCLERIGGFFRDFERLDFRTIHLLVEGAFASWTYELTGSARDGSHLVISSIEVFEVVGGKIARVWNAEHTSGPWA